MGSEMFTMPEPDIKTVDIGCAAIIGYTADQLRAAVLEALERAAELAADMDYGTEIAPAIRQLAEQVKKGGKNG